MESIGLSKIITSNKLLNFLCSLPRYYSTWNVLLIVFAAYFNDYIDILFSATVVAVLGFYLTHFSPGYLIVNMNEIQYKLANSKIWDAIVHQAPFLYCLFTLVAKQQNKQVDHRTLVTLALFCSYYVLNGKSINDLYGISVYELVVVFNATIIVYILFHCVLG